MFAAIAYVATVLAANVATEHMGLVPVGFGLMVTAGTYAAGLSFVLRDVTQDALGRWAVLGCILAGGALSWWLSSPALAVASTAAFLLSELADMALYTPLRERGWARAVLVSGALGAIVDTVVFLWLAPFPLTTAAVAGQMLGKGWAQLAPVAFVALLRQSDRQRSRA